MILKLDFGKFLILTLPIGLLPYPTALPSQAQVSSTDARGTPSERIIFFENFDPPNGGQPKGNTNGAGSRDGQRCSASKQPIKPLMPKRNYGLTFEEHPSIYVKLPKTTAKKVVLTFQDEAGQSYQRAFLPIANNSGIVSFALPQEKTPLAVGKNYQWNLVIVCGDRVQPDDPVFRGWVQRVERSPQTDKELQHKSLIEQAKWFAKRGFWYDTLKALSEARQVDPDNTQLTALWQDFLNSAGLGD